MPASRLASLDLLRGAVMVLMAIDHVRVYSGLPAGGPAPGIFFTRWITHFCAPAFVFLAGTAAFLYARSHHDVQRFLITRGAWFIVLELTLLRVAWTFNLDFTRYNMLGVIWVIGACMILLALMVRLPLAALAAFGLIVIAGHNLLDPAIGGDAAAWKVLYLGFFAGPITIAGSSVWVLYSLVPWVGVIAAGYAFGAIMRFEPQRRDRLCVAIGVGATAAFFVLRGFNIYGDPRPWSAPGAGEPNAMPALLAFLNTNKYPASLAFVLMTLGPTIALLPLAERARGTAARTLTVFGRVPFFYYVLHIPLIHALALLVSRVRLGTVSPWLFADHPMAPPPPPDGYVWSLPLLYAVWALALVILYISCRWFAGLKARRGEWWLRYI